jgi:hypothetical protein
LRPTIPNYEILKFLVECISDRQLAKNKQKDAKKLVNPSEADYPVTAIPNTMAIQPMRI